jgi:hypothetical protein
MTELHAARIFFLVLLAFAVAGFAWLSVKD